tara:strand:+ start:111300 stop:112532 length:1233 start_codon:yes stop_codon:yes gene_type:complete
MTNSKGFNIQEIRKQFPILNQKVNGRDLVYFDNAATSQKPQVVIDSATHYYSTINSNVHRGVHHLSQLATDAMEASRDKVQRHLNAAKREEIIFTKGTTDGINLIASGMGKGWIKAGDEIIISALEHHSNIVPWQMLCEQTGAILKVIPMLENGELDLDQYSALLNSKTKLVSINHISNALGTINPVHKIIEEAHKAQALVLLDGAQALPHMRVDVQELDVDFYVFSGHKIFGPTGIGILYGKEDLLDKLPPYQGGGEMIKSVSFEKTTYAGLPHKFEAGTPNIEACIGIGHALDFMNSIGVENIGNYEQELLNYASQKLSQFEKMRFIGTAKNKASLISFLLGDIHPYDAGVILDKLGIAVRTGHHCAQPIMDFYSIPGTIRASFAFYNTKEEIDQLVKGLKKVEMMLS